METNNTKRRALGRGLEELFFNEPIAYDKVEEKIIEAGNNILNGNFNINPKRIGDELIGCKYCKFKDLCYKTKKDIVKLEEINNLKFLGGE